MKEDKNYPYLNMRMQDESGVCIEHRSDTRVVGMHCHNYYEWMVIDSGSSNHFYNNTNTMLIPGDAVLIAPHKAHGYSFQGEVSVYNFQFQVEFLDEKVVQLLEKSQVLEQEENRGQEVKYWEELLTRREDFKNADYPTFEINNSKQGVIHLSPAERSKISVLMQYAAQAQVQADVSAMIEKQKYAELILLELKKAQEHQNQKYLISSSSNQKMVAELLRYIEENLAEEIDIAGFAKAHSFSPNHFRKIFKDMTGLSPVAYINRLRIQRACDCIQKQSMSIKEAAEYVGIYDCNYFSRMFKKVMGYSPGKL